MNQVMSWPDIIVKYGYGLALESDHKHNNNPYRDEKEHHRYFHTTKHGAGSEFEVSNFIRSLIMLFKFRNILETGAEQGHTTLAMANACHFNTIGHVTTVDHCHIGNPMVKERLEETGMTPYVTQIKEETTNWARNYDGPPFDFAFFDCGHESRISACRSLLKNGKLTRVISFHDADKTRTDEPLNTKYCQEIVAIQNEIAATRDPEVPTGLWNILSRGFAMIQIAF